MFNVFLFILLILKAFAFSAETDCDMQKLIKKLHQNVQERYERLCPDEYSSKMLVFLGTSERDIHTVILSLNDGQCAQISSENAESRICYLADIDFTQVPYCIAYKVTEDAATDTNFLDFLICASDIPSFIHEKCVAYFVNTQQLPLVLVPVDKNISIDDFTSWAEQHQAELRSLIASQGGILLRGFPINQAEDFAAMVRSIIGKNLVDYKGEGSRKRIVQGVYTSTEAPLNFKIPLHNELSCTTNPIDYICFYCEIAPEAGTGQTLLAKTENITSAMHQNSDIWNLYYGKNIQYISRHPSEGHFLTRINPTHRTWQQAFETTDKNEVEKICQQKGYTYNWNGDWVEITRYAPAILEPDAYFDHPYWFNQAHLYHSNSRLYGGWLNYMLSKLLYISPSTRQYDVKFDDGSTIPRKIIYKIYDILDENTVKFDWREGDILLLDNRRALHGRAPSEGPRRILVSMVQ